MASVKIIQRKEKVDGSKINKCLSLHVAKAASIDKKIAIPIARHSFGNISNDRTSIQMLQELYCHTKLEATIGYQANIIHEYANDALDAIYQSSP